MSEAKEESEKFIEDFFDISFIQFTREYLYKIQLLFVQSFIKLNALDMNHVSPLHLLII